MFTERIADLELLIGHHFRDKGYIENALSHSSIKTTDRPSNERLEFLGDSVLGLIISDALYRRFPEDDEGTLTRIKSQAVSRATLQRIALAMGLDRYIVVGKGVAKREIPASLLGNLFEAIVGAIYLDAGLASSRKFILRHLDIVIHEILEDRAEKNYKSMLQHYCQRDLGAVPTYRVLRESGPAHGRAFEVVAVVSGKEYGRARADSKKEAEQGAARAALIHFKQVQEEASKPRRGAGVVLRVGVPGESKKRRKRGGRRSRGEKPLVPQEANDGRRLQGDPAPAEKTTLPREGSKEGGRRRRRSGRRRRGEGGRDAPSAAAAAAPTERVEESRREIARSPEPAARSPTAPESRRRAAASPAPKKIARKKTTKKPVARKKTTKTAVKKKSTPVRRKRKKTSGPGADGVE